MRLLIDTNVFLRYAEDRLETEWMDAMDGAEQVFFSAVSMFEIAILSTKGRLSAGTDPSAFVNDGMQRLQLMPLDIVPRHVLATANLPRHHGDPFDRLLIAQALCERLTIMTSDRAIALYDVPIFGKTTRKSKT